jgi:hypothetical protein
MGASRRSPISIRWSLPALLLAAVGASDHAIADPLPSFPDFSSTAGLTLNGNAQQVGSVLRLTAADQFTSAAGTAWFNSPISLSIGFESVFTFRITPGALYNGEAGDGISFTIQDAGLGALGFPGSSIGYGGIPDSLAVEFDTFQNNQANTALFGDPNGNHVSVHTRGVDPNSADEAFSLGSSTSIPTLDDAQVHTARIDYLPGKLQVFMDGSSAPYVSVPVDLANLLATPDSFFGFTAGSGGATSDHDILSWSLVQIPEPGTLALVSIGLSAIAAVRRRSETSLER